MRVGYACQHPFHNILVLGLTPEFDTLIGRLEPSKSSSIHIEHFFVRPSLLLEVHSFSPTYL